VATLPAMQSLAEKRCQIPAERQKWANYTKGEQNCWGLFHRNAILLSFRIVGPFLALCGYLAPFFSQRGLLRWALVPSAHGTTFRLGACLHCAGGHPASNAVFG
jgi:hypothetical protein